MKRGRERMAVINRCESCGVPAMIGREMRWEGNGVISLANSPRDRMVFFESNTIDSMFRGIGELIGKPIEPLVIESRRRETRKFMERSFPFEVRNVHLLGESDMKAGTSFYSRVFMETVTRMRKELNQKVLEVGSVFGYGNQSLSEKWDRGEDYPWRTQIIRNPYSVPLWVADTLGSVEAFEGIDMTVHYETIGDDALRVSTFPGKHPLELEKRLKRKHYAFKPGQITYERCPECGVPLEISRYRWNLKDGSITAADTGRRVAILGPLALEAIFSDLEATYGLDVVEAAIEAQRRYVRSQVDARELRLLVFKLEDLTALRGLGNVTRLDADERHVSMTIENSCIHLLVVGMAQALYELALNREDSRREWELAADGDLNITIY
ncbi:MAG: hypothetical protein C4536_14585 [Actinobacteria bacterium]|nr:MAG: hypothetical protein C4536_14585 [Actinomycetota bacterium]